MRNALVAWTICTLLGAVSFAQDGPKPIGLVKTVSGDATIVRAGSSFAATPGLPLFQGDVLRTGSPGSLGVIMRDDTSLSLGSGSDVALTEFAFEPAEGKMAFVVRLTRGMIGYLSGRIAKLAPDAARVETPVATLGIRGTRLAARIAR